MSTNSMAWGYAGVFPGAFGVRHDDPVGRLAFMQAHGFRCTGIGLSALDDPQARDAIARFVADNDFCYSVHFGCKYFTDAPDDLLAQVDAFIEKLASVKDLLRARLVTTTAGPYHRFMRDPSLAFQMDRLKLVLTPLAKACQQMGIAMGIENHCDYFITDLAKLCAEVPHLGIFWDTGNTFMTGETPLAVSRLAAPLVVGTHFKDYYCYPDEKELKLVVTGASLGDGDVGLEQIYRDLVELNPHPEKLLMEFELIPDKAIGPVASLERSKRFIERVTGNKFRYPEAVAV